ncbi:MAG: hypothetical protein K2N18_06190, partial [Clostridia bacterium]|nr:hypothetical protein [Clostridia bacterium]
VRKSVSISASATSCLSPKQIVNPYVNAYAGGIAAVLGDNVKSENVVKVYSEAENLESKYELKVTGSLLGEHEDNCKKGTDAYVASYTKENFTGSSDDKLESIKAASEQEVLNEFNAAERNADGKLYTVEVLAGYKDEYDAGSAEFDTTDLKIKVNGSEVDYGVLAVYGFDTFNESRTNTKSGSVYMLFYTVINGSSVMLSTGGMNITVGVNKVVSVDALNLKDEYVSGTFSVVGMRLRLNYAVGEPEYVIINDSNKNEVTVAGDIDTFGESELELTYNGYKINYTINVICGHGDKFTEASSGYAYNESLSKDPTCTEIGYDAYECATCGDVKCRYYAKTPHVADEENVVGAIEATCYHEGNTGVLKCANCDCVLDEGSVIPKLEHYYESYNDTLHKCANEESKFENHQYLVSESLEQTVDSNGATAYSVVYTYTCQSCGHIREITDTNTITEEEQTLPIVMVSSGYALK